MVERWIPSIPWNLFHTFNIIWHYTMFKCSFANRINQFNDYLCASSMCKHNDLVEWFFLYVIRKSAFHKTIADCRLCMHDVRAKIHQAKSRTNNAIADCGEIKVNVQCTAKPWACCPQMDITSEISCKCDGAYPSLLHLPHNECDYYFSASRFISSLIVCQCFGDAKNITHSVSVVWKSKICWKRKRKQKPWKMIKKFGRHSFTWYILAHKFKFDYWDNLCCRIKQFGCVLCGLDLYFVIVSGISIWILCVKNGFDSFTFPFKAAFNPIYNIKSWNDKHIKCALSC